MLELLGISPVAAFAVFWLVASCVGAYLMAECKQG